MDNVLKAQQDALRYNRLRILGVTIPELDPKPGVKRFQNLDEMVDADIKFARDRGEYNAIGTGGLIGGTGAKQATDSMTNQASASDAPKPFNGIRLNLKDRYNLDVPFRDKFKLGKSSIKELIGCHSILVDLAMLAIRITEQDFSVHDGLRTPEEQVAYLKAGTTTTLRSKHLKQPDGFSHAMDLVPFQNGAKVWDWTLVYPVVLAVTVSAIHLDVAHRIRWGGAWDRVLSDFMDCVDDPADFAEEVKKYCERHARKDFIDGPHFELVA